MKKYIIFLLGSIAILGFSSCSDWLEADPKDKNLEEKQYSTENNINNVLNGFYTGMASENLYGGQMTMTTLENLAHYYYVPQDLTNSKTYLNFSYLQDYKYDDSYVKGRFSQIWSEAYSLIMGINKFIANIEGTSVVTKEKRDVLLGEAYALRAFLHFDIFRLFGPIYSKDDGTVLLPYNDKAGISVHQYLPSGDFLGKIRLDIDKAEELLKNDPILEYGILNSESSSAVVSSEEIFAKYMRNRRMNLIATKALKARFLAYTDELEQAAAVADEVLSMSNIVEDINGSNTKAVFRWIVYNDIAESSKRDYIFKNEVLFGIENSKLHDRWTEYTQSSNIGKVYAIHGVNLLVNIFGNEEAGSPTVLSDARARQWTAADDIGASQYVSLRFRKLISEDDNSKQMSLFVQPLMRITELYYIIIENEIKSNNLSRATDLLNSVLRRRNYKSNEEIQFPSTAGDDVLKSFAERLETILQQEYYREFYAEGQAFFFLKRRASSKIYKSAGVSGSENIDIANYTVPIPQDEINK